MFFRNNTRLLYANIFIKMDIEKDSIFNKGVKESQQWLALTLFWLQFSMLIVEKGSVWFQFYPWQIALQRTERLFLCVLIHLKSYVENMKSWKEKKIIREILLAIGFIFRKKPKLNISTKHSGVLFYFYLRTVKLQTPMFGAK